MGKVIWIHATVPEEVSEGDFALDSEYLDAWPDDDEVDRMARQYALDRAAEGLPPEL